MALTLSTSGKSALRTGLTIPATVTVLMLYKPAGAIAGETDMARLANSAGDRSWRMRPAFGAASKIEFKAAYTSEIAVSAADVVDEEWNLIAGCVDAAGTGKILCSVNGEAYVEGDTIVGDVTECDRVSVQGNADASIDIAEVLVINGKVSEATLAAMYAAIGGFKPSLAALTVIYHDRLKTAAAATMTLTGTPPTAEGGHPYVLSPVHNLEGSIVQANGQEVATVAYLDAEIAALSAIYAPIAKGLEQYKVTTGNDSDTEITVTHNLNSRDVMVTVWDLVTNGRLHPSIELTSVNAAVLTFNEAPAENSVRVIVSKRTN